MTRIIPVLLLLASPASAVPPTGQESEWLPERLFKRSLLLRAYARHEARCDPEGPPVPGELDHEWISFDGLLWQMAEDRQLDIQSVANLRRARSGAAG
jgi:hypothetical protein